MRDAIERRIDGGQLGRLVLVHRELFVDFGGGLRTRVGGAHIVRGRHVNTGDLTTTLLCNARQQLLAFAEQAVLEWGLGCVHGFMLGR